MESIAVLLALGLLGLLVAGPIVALVAAIRVSRVSARVDELAREMRGLEGQLRVLRRDAATPGAERGAAPAPVPPPAGVVAVPPPAARPGGEPPFAAPASEPPAPPRPVEPPRAAAPGAPLGMPPRPAAPRPSTPHPPAGPDFVSNLGPKILVGTGALAFTVFLALFVKYAWDNDWVGPTGRVLSSAVFALGLLVAGVRLLGRQYRPLGQGLMAAGLSGLYATAFASHSVYALVPRPVSGFLMIAVTASAVLLADRLGARLLATLAWLGGYLMPLLLSTGEDRAIALFAYLALLDAGALVLDHRKPWAETVPLAMLGTLTLYGGWFVRYFSAERFEVAVGGLILFTALFLFGMARKERGWAMAVVIALSAVGVAILGGAVNRPEVLLFVSLALGGAALWGASRVHAALALPAAFAIGLPLVVWAGFHLDAHTFAIAAAWLLAGVLAFALVPVGGEARSGTALLAVVMIAAGLAIIPLAPVSPAPLPVSALLVSFALIAVLARRRLPYAEAIGAAAAALAAQAWLASHLDPARAYAAWAVAAPAAGLLLAALALRAVRGQAPMDAPEVAGHLAAAAFAWSALYRILSLTQPALLGPAAAGLAVVYALIAVAGRTSRPGDLVHARLAWGLTASFVTLAIPVQLGLHGITLGWALEGLVLLGIGLRSGSALTRAAGYGVIGLAVLRLFGWHLPLHRGEFVPVWNASFGIWLAVIASLAGALLLARSARREGSSPDRALGPVLAAGALLLLFGLLTGEIQAGFGQRASAALLAGDGAGMQSALRSGALAVSVLWTVFATALLAGGLYARSHGLFYAAYALFAVTAGKVVLVDLGSFPVPYRMLSFLALGLLLMAGAYLNLRFRERLATQGGHGA